METCIACACELKKGTAQRRKLYSPSTCHLLPVLQGLCKECYSCEDVNRLHVIGGGRKFCLGGGGGGGGQSINIRAQSAREIFGTRPLN